jgi:hypothetical protein
LTSSFPRGILLQPADDVAITTGDAGTAIDIGGQQILLGGDVPRGHKLAVRDIAAGDPVRRYGQVIGFAQTGIAAGEQDLGRSAVLHRAKASQLRQRDDRGGLPAEVDHLVRLTRVRIAGCSPWRSQSEPTTSPNAVTDGGGGADMRRASNRRYARKYELRCSLPGGAQTRSIWRTAVVGCMP